MSAVRRTVVLTMPMAAVVVAALLTSPAVAGAARSRAAAPAASPGQCPPVLPVSAVRDGMVGRGLTVARGKTPEAFRAEVRGVVRNGIAPGRDLIIVEASDFPGGDVIAQGGGIWAGMSGSPVYVSGKLLGAIAYGFTAAPSPIGGVTPAEDMAELLDLPVGARNPAIRIPARVVLPKALRARLGGAAASGTSLERLRIPLGVSGLGAQRISQLQDETDRAGLRVVAHTAGSAGAPTRSTPMVRPTAGGNFVSALSYGDLTVAATGTTTAVGGAKALAFGHPLAFAGAVSYGANDTDALAVVRDDTFGAFKFATISRLFGTVDQDRLAGVRGRLGQVPATTPIETSITNVDLGRSRSGRTAVTAQRFLPILTLFSILASYDAVFDEIGDGTATNTWTIAGTRAGGRTFALARSNRWASQSDVAFEPALDLAVTVDRILNNPYEQVSVDRVRYSSAISTVYAALTLIDALVSVDGGPLGRPSALEVRPGSLLRVRAVLQPYRSPTTRTVELALRVPSGTSGRFGSLDIVGGAGSTGGPPEAACLLADGGCRAAQVRPSLDTLLDELRSRPRNDDLSLVLRLDPAEGGGEPITRTTTERQNQVVIGFQSFPVSVR